MEASLIVTNPRVGYRRLEGEQKMVNNYCFRVIQFNDANLMYFYWFLMAIRPIGSIGENGKWSVGQVVRN